MNRRCDFCLFFDVCNDGERPCRFYAPIDDELSDIEIEEFNSRRKEEFVRQWEIYTRGWN